MAIRLKRHHDRLYQYVEIRYPLGSEPTTDVHQGGDAAALLARVALESIVPLFELSGQRALARELEKGVAHALDFLANPSMDPL